jgi:hypothetical protein
MELLLVPVTLTLGGALIFFGVNGLPSSPQLSRSGAAGTVRLPARVASRPGMPARFELLQPKQAATSKNDLLLADLMSEMIAIRAEMAELRGKFEAAIAQSRPAPVRVRRTMKKAS